MKRFIAGSIILLSLESSALEIQFIGPCSEKPLYSTVVESTEAKDVGNLSIEVLEKAQIPYQGTYKGIYQIQDSPVGLDAMEVISDHEMLSYGWCFEVDGEMPDVYPDEIALKGVRRIRWIYGYAQYLNGEWVTQCKKSYLRRSPFICKN